MGHERPRLLDLFCGAGGATKGYQRAGFYVVGVDIAPQPNYCGDEFVQADAMLVMEDLLEGWPLGGFASGYDLGDFAAVHASPVCKRWSQVTRTAGTNDRHDDQITPLRPILEASGLPYVIENVPGAPLRDPILLCGSMFDLDVKRHRLFETNWGLVDHHWPCRHRIWGARYAPNRSDRRRNPNARAKVVTVVGGGGGLGRESPTGGELWRSSG